MDLGQIVKLYLFSSLFVFHAVFLLYDFNVLDVGPMTW